MTRNQKWLKGLTGGKATPKTMNRALERGPEYRAQFTLEHDVKRRKLLKKRQDAPQKGRYKVEKELAPSEWDTITQNK